MIGTGIINTLKIEPNTGMVLLFESPRISERVNGILLDGEKVQIIQSAKDYWYLKTDEGRQGYCFKEWVKVETLLAQDN